MGTISLLQVAFDKNVS